LPADVAGLDAFDAAQLVERGFETPEASARERRDLLVEFVSIIKFPLM
jgi:hypothetical protein